VLSLVGGHKGVALQELRLHRFFTEYVKLRSYDESVLCAPLDRARRIVQRSFLIFPTTNAAKAIRPRFSGQLSLAPMASADSVALTMGVRTFSSVVRGED
jgi:hypothetical protein